MVFASIHFEVVFQKQLRAVVSVKHQERGGRSLNLPSFDTWASVVPPCSDRSTSQDLVSATFAWYVQHPRFAFTSYAWFVKLHD